MTSGRGRSLRVDIAGDADKLKRELAAAQRAVKEAERDLARMGIEQGNVAASASRLGAELQRQETIVGNLRSRWGAYTAGLTAVVAAGGAAVYTTTRLVEVARQEEQARARVTEIFEGQTGVIQEWAAQADQSIGLSRRAALQAAGDFGNMFDQLGFGREQVVGMSTDIVKLAADYSAFHDADITNVIVAQSAAFRGEYDALQRFVPTINAARVEQKAMELGLAATTKQLTAQDKALATYRIMMDESGKAVGAFERESGELTGQQASLRAELENLRSDLGKLFIPMVADATSALNDFLDEHGEDIARDIAAGVGAIGSAAAGLRDTLVEIAGIGLIQVPIEIAMSEGSSAALAALAALAGLKGFGAGAAGLGAFAATDFVATPAARGVFGEDNPGFAEWVLGGATAPFKLAGLLGGPVLDSLRNPGGRDGFSDEEIAFFQQHPEQFSPMAANSIRRILRERQAASLGGITEGETGSWDGQRSARPTSLTPEEEREVARFQRATADLSRQPNLGLIRQQMEQRSRRTGGGSSRAGGGSSGQTPAEIAAGVAEEATREYFGALRDITRDQLTELSDAYFSGGAKQVEIVREQQAEILREVTRKANELRLALGVDLAEAMRLAKGQVDALAESERILAEERQRAEEEMKRRQQEASRGALGALSMLGPGTSAADAEKFFGGIRDTLLLDARIQAGEVDPASLSLPISAGLRPYDGDYRQTGPNSGGYGITNYGEINVNADQVDAESLMRLQDRMVE